MQARPENAYGSLVTLYTSNILGKVKFETLLSEYQGSTAKSTTMVVAMVVAAGGANAMWAYAEKPF